MKHQPFTANESSLVLENVRKDAEARYGWPYKDKKVEVAVLTARETMNYYNSLPIGCNLSDVPKIRKGAEEHVKSFLPVIGIVAFILYWTCVGIIIYYVHDILKRKL